MIYIHPNSIEVCSSLQSKSVISKHGKLSHEIDKELPGIEESYIEAQEKISEIKKDSSKIE